MLHIEKEQGITKKVRTKITFSPPTVQWKWISGQIRCSKKIIVCMNKRTQFSLILIAIIDDKTRYPRVTTNSMNAWCRLPNFIIQNQIRIFLRSSSHYLFLGRHLLTSISDFNEVKSTKLINENLINNFPCLHSSILHNVLIILSHVFTHKHSIHINSINAVDLLYACRDEVKLNYDGNLD